MITPINCMAEIIDQVIEDQGPESDEQYSLEIVRNTTQVIASFIQTNLDRSALDDDTITPHLSQENLIEGVVKPAIDIFIVQAQTRCFELDLNINLNSERVVQIDKYKTQQVLINLVQNAIKFSQPYDVIKVFVDEVSVDREANLTDFVISVVDQGPGLDPNDRKVLF